MEMLNKQLLYTEHKGISSPKKELDLDELS